MNCGLLQESKQKMTEGGDDNNNKIKRIEFEEINSSPISSRPNATSDTTNVANA